MSPAQRDVAARLIQSPWWVVVGLVATGAIYANTLQGEIREVRDKIIPLAEIRRELDSLRIEQRHIGQTVQEIRHLLGRAQ